MFWFRKTNRVPVGSLVIPQDLHTHLIPGVDDGRFTPQSAADTIARMYAKGTRQVCLTPHMISGLYEAAPEELERRMQAIVDLAGVAAPELFLGAEYMVDDHFRAHVAKGGDVLALPGNRVLIEMSYYAESPQIFEVVSILKQRGFDPVLAHPERYLYMERRMEDFDRLHDMGCAFQLNILSATGIYGATSLRIVRNLFERSYYGFAGSDVHSPAQYESLYGSYMSEKIASEGVRAGLWSIAE